MKDPGAKYFNCTDAERAAFEAGIKLGTIYHQFIGAPVTLANVRDLENAIENGASVQPFASKVKVRIKRDGLKGRKGVYSYKTLTGQMLDVDLVVRYEGVEAVTKLRHVKAIDYPLMYIKKIRKVEKSD